MVYVIVPHPRWVVWQVAPTWNLLLGLPSSRGRRQIRLCSEILAPEC